MHMMLKTKRLSFMKGNHCLIGLIHPPTLIQRQIIPKLFIWLMVILKYLALMAPMGHGLQKVSIHRHCHNTKVQGLIYTRSKLQLSIVHFINLQENTLTSILLFIWTTIVSVVRLGRFGRTWNLSMQASRTTFMMETCLGSIFKECGEIFNKQ